MAQAHAHHLYKPLHVVWVWMFPPHFPQWCDNQKVSWYAVCSWGAQFKSQRGRKLLSVKVLLEHLRRPLQFIFLFLLSYVMIYLPPALLNKRNMTRWVWSCKVCKLPGSVVWISGGASKRWGSELVIRHWTGWSNDTHFEMICDHTLMISCEK